MSNHPFILEVDAEYNNLLGFPSYKFKLPNGLVISILEEPRFLDLYEIAFLAGNSFYTINLVFGYDDVIRYISIEKINYLIDKSMRIPKSTIDDFRYAQGSL